MLDVDGEPRHGSGGETVLAAAHGTRSGESIPALVDYLPRVPSPITLAMEAFSNRQVKPRENFTTQRDLLADAFFLATLWQDLGPKILARRRANTVEARHLKGRSAGWKYCYEYAYPDDSEDMLLRGASTTRALHLDVREAPFPRK